ncbi:glycosyltransferase family 4 protein [Lachnospiraceae bacterium 62-35]
MELGWIFPYEAVGKGDSIVIYGAGQMGRSLVRQIKQTNYCSLILWIDRKSEEYQKEGLDVKDIECIKQIGRIDKFLIAIHSLAICSEVREKLKDYGIEPEKIWTPFLGEQKALQKNDIKNYFYPVSDNGPSDKKQEMNLHSLDIAFLIPAPIQGGGGHRNIFRAVKYLAAKGHKVTVYYTQTEDSENEVKRHVSEWFYNMEDVTFVKFKGECGFHDVGIATWWETAYVLNARKNNFRSLFYFVQDYEAYFYPMSSDYLLAENSYSLGMFHICSGQWCKEKIQEKYNARAVYFQFPVDKGIYYARKREKSNKNIVFFAKPDMPRRCYEIGVRALKIFKKQRPDVEIIMFGSKNLIKEEIPFDVTIKNIVPTLDGLAEMYANADLGVVFSPTNPSLVPYEMMSCGCPVVDLDMDGAIYKYGNDRNNIFLLSIDAAAFAESLSAIIDDEKLLKCHAESGRRWVETEFPSELEMEEFIERTIIREVSQIIEEQGN